MKGYNYIFKIQFEDTDRESADKYLQEILDEDISLMEALQEAENWELESVEDV